MTRCSVCPRLIGSKVYDPTVYKCMNDAPLQEVFFKVTPISPVSGRQLIEARWKPSVYKAMLADPDMPSTIILVGLGNPWHFVSFVSTSAIARREVARLRKTSPEKNYRFRDHPEKIQ